MAACAADYLITEGTPLSDPFWQYSRDKIACEDYLMRMYRENGFTVTIVRPSHTYGERNLPLGVHGDNGSWQIVKRMLGDKSNTVVFDNSKVKRAVPGFVCTVRADQGLRKTVRHMLATPELQKEDPEFDQLCDCIIGALEKAKESLRRGN